MLRNQLRLRAIDISANRMRTVGFGILQYVMSLSGQIDIASVA